MIGRRFDGKTALITGGSRGLGKGIVKALLCEGAKVYALGKSKENLNALKSELPDVCTIVADVSEWEVTRKALEEIGTVDLLVNNAGMGNPPQMFVDVPPETLNEIIDVNFKSAFNISQVVARKLILSGRPGSIVNMSSMASKVGFPRIGPYAISKAMLDMMTKCMALELGPHKIRVNSVNPTFVKTDMTELFFNNEAVSSDFLTKHPLCRYPDIKDVVNATLFLLSGDASMITGSCLSVDSGLQLS